MQPRASRRAWKRQTCRHWRTCCAAVLVVSALACGGSFFVSPDTVVSITLSPTSPTLLLGSTEQFAATGTTAGGSTKDVSALATWSSSNSAVAAISSDGLLTARSAGTTTVTASFQRGSAQTVAAVSSATLTALTLSPANTSIVVGATSQYTATGVFSDGSTQNLTGTVTWSSSNGNVATISTAGLATGISAGSTTITAASGSISAQTTLTVLQ